MAEVIRIEVEFTPEAAESGKDEVMQEVSQKNLMLLANRNDVFQVRIDSYIRNSPETPDPKDIEIRELRKDLKKISIAYLAAIEVINNPGKRIALLGYWTSMEEEARMIVNAL
jgi:hypothetical protein